MSIKTPEQEAFDINKALSFGTITERSLSDVKVVQSLLVNTFRTRDDEIACETAKQIIKYIKCTLDTLVIDKAPAKGRVIQLKHLYRIVSDIENAFINKV